VTIFLFIYIFFCQVVAAEVLIKQCSEIPNKTKVIQVKKIKNSGCLRKLLSLFFF